MSKELNSVKVRIANLMALSANNNSTGEASVAMAKAGKLMEEWALTIEDIELGDEEIIHDRIYTGRKQKPELSNLLTTLAKFTNIKLWVTTPKRGYRFAEYEINLMGYATDIEIFKYFWSMLTNTFEFEYSEYQKTDEFSYQTVLHHGRKVRASFRNGFVNEIYQTLVNLTEEKIERSVTKSGTALVPLKNGKIEAEFNERFNMKLTKKRSYSRSGGTTATQAGQSAGANVRFSRGVGSNGGGGQKLLA